MTLIGHKASFDIFLQILEPLKARSFGIYAPEGVGRRIFVQEAFTRASRTSWERNPDFKEIHSSGSISISSLRDLTPWLETPPTQSRFKMLAISPGELLTSEAQDVLLKLLEDPPEYLVVCIMASSPSLNPQILSRLFPVRLFHLSQVDSEKIWGALSISPSVFKQFWELSPGQPGQAPPRFSRKYPQFLKSLITLFEGNPSAMSFFQWMDQIPPWTLEESHDFWQWALPQVYKKSSGSQAIFISLAAEAAISNPSIALENFLPSLFYTVCES